MLQGSEEPGRPMDPGGENEVGSELTVTGRMSADAQDSREGHCQGALSRGGLTGPGFLSEVAQPGGSE